MLEDTKHLAGKLKQDEVLGGQRRRCYAGGQVASRGKQVTEGTEACVAGAASQREVVAFLI